MGAIGGTEFTKKIEIFWTTPSFAENAAKLSKSYFFFTFSAKFVPTSTIFFSAIFAVKSNFNVSGIKIGRYYDLIGCYAIPKSFYFHIRLAYKYAKIKYYFSFASFELPALFLLILE